MRQLNYCTVIPRAREMFPWGSALAKRLKTTDLGDDLRNINSNVRTECIKINSSNKKLNCKMSQCE